MGGTLRGAARSHGVHQSAEFSDGQRLWRHGGVYCMWHCGSEVIAAVFLCRAFLAEGFAEDFEGRLVFWVAHFFFALD